MGSRNIPINSGESSHLQPETDTFEASQQYRVVDKRHFTDAAAASPVTGYTEEKPRYPTYVEELLAKVADTERRFKEKVAQIDQETARTKARLAAEYERKLVLDKVNLLQPFLDVLDNLERALQAVPVGGAKSDLLAGVKMTVELFQAKLKAQSIEPIDVMNLPFDPKLSLAVGVVPVNNRARDGIVVEELLRGYRMGETLLRPAQVRVGEFRPEC